MGVRDYDAAVERIIEDSFDVDRIRQGKNRQERSREFLRQMNQLERSGLITDLKSKYDYANYAYKLAADKDESLLKAEFNQRNIPDIFKKDQAADRARRTGKRTVYEEKEKTTKAYEKWSNGKTVSVTRDNKGRFAAKIEG